MWVLRQGHSCFSYASSFTDVTTFWARISAALRWTTLKPGGLCFILVPNMKSLATRLLGSKYRYIYPQHLNYFTAEMLKKLCSRHFSTVELRSTHFNPLVIWQDWRRGGEEISNEQRAELLQRTTSYKQNPLLRPVKVFYQLVER